jgi:hypothetical protein
VFRAAPDWLRRTAIRKAGHHATARLLISAQTRNVCVLATLCSAAVTGSSRAPRAGALIEEARFAADSPLEGDGFELPVPARDRSRRAAVQKTLGVARQPFEQVQLVIEFRARRRIAVRQIQASDDQAADGRLDVAAMRII